MDCGCNLFNPRMTQHAYKKLSKLPRCQVSLVQVEDIKHAYLRISIRNWTPARGHHDGSALRMSRIHILCENMLKPSKTFLKPLYYTKDGEILSNASLGWSWSWTRQWYHGMNKIIPHDDVLMDLGTSGTKGKYFYKGLFDELFQSWLMCQCRFFASPVSLFDERFMIQRHRAGKRLNTQAQLEAAWCCDYSDFIPQLTRWYSDENHLSKCSVR